MTDPFGFSTGGAPFGSGVPDDVAAKIPLFAELRKLLAADGPVNWELARQIAIAAAAPQDPAVDSAADGAVADAIRLADLWLDAVTTLPSGVASAQAWTRVGWVEATLPAWSALCDPVARRVVAAMDGVLPEQLRGQGGPMLDLLGKVAGLMFGAQVGQALGGLAGEVTGTTDVGLPMVAAGRAALLPAGVAAFGAGLGVPDDEVRLYLALREAAHHRLYGHVPWLRAHVVGAVEAYARGIVVDADAVQRALAEVDPADPQSIQAVLGGGFFQTGDSPEQQVALARLETALALVEGWVAEVVGAAARDHLPAAARLDETARRRRATGGPAEQTFATLVGLELRPRRHREAAALWRALYDVRGVDGRDGVWAHPDLLPDAGDLDDPSGYVSGTAD